MSRQIVILLIVFLLLLASPVQAVNRIVSLEADGVIELHTVTGNNASKAALKIEGEGKISYNGEGSLNSTNLAQAYRVEVMSAKDALRPLTVISAVQIANGKGAAYVYALMVAPARGESGLLDIFYQADTEAFAALDLSAKAFVSRGEFRNYIDIYSPDDSSTLKEEIRVLGYANFMDLMKISNPAESE